MADPSISGERTAAASGTNTEPMFALAAEFEQSAEEETREMDISSLRTRGAVSNSPFLAMMKNKEGLVGRGPAVNDTPHGPTSVNLAKRQEGKDRNRDHTANLNISPNSGSMSGQHRSLPAEENENLTNGSSTGCSTSPAEAAAEPHVNRDTSTGQIVQPTQPVVPPEQGHSLAPSDSTSKATETNTDQHAADNLNNHPCDSGSISFKQNPFLLADRAGKSNTLPSKIKGSLQAQLARQFNAPNGTVSNESNESLTSLPKLAMAWSQKRSLPSMDMWKSTDASNHVIPKGPVADTRSGKSKLDTSTTNSDKCKGEDKAEILNQNATVKQIGEQKSEGISMKFHGFWPIRKGSPDKRKSQSGQVTSSKCEVGGKTPSGSTLTETGQTPASTGNGVPAYTVEDKVPDITENSSSERFGQRLSATSPEGLKVNPANTIPTIEREQDIVESIPVASTATAICGHMLGAAKVDPLPSNAVELPLESGTEQNLANESSITKDNNDQCLDQHSAAPLHSAHITPTEPVLQVPEPDTSNTEHVSTKVDEKEEPKIVLGSKPPTTTEEEEPRIPSSAANNMKNRIKRIWSPTKLQIPSVSLGSFFEDSDWLSSFMGSHSKSSKTSTVEDSAQAQSTASLESVAVDVATAAEVETHEKGAKVKTKGSPRTGSSPCRRDSLGQLTVFTHRDSEDSTLSLVDSIDEGFEEDIEYATLAPPAKLPREDSLASIVDDIIGSKMKTVKKHNGKRKTVRFGRAWKGELETKRILYSTSEMLIPASEWPKGRTGILYLKICRMQDMVFNTDHDIDVTINIRQQKAEREYELETDATLRSGENHVILDFECEIPLLPKHSLSFVFYFKSRLNADDLSVTAPSTNRHHARLDSQPQRKSKRLTKLFRGRKQGDMTLPKTRPPISTHHSTSEVLDANSNRNLPVSTSRSSSLSSFTHQFSADTPAPHKAGDTWNFLPGSLLVAETELSESDWGNLLEEATGKIRERVFDAHVLQWRGALVHGDLVGKIACRMGYLPFMNDVELSLLPQTWDEYDLSVRVQEWNDALSMEGHLWQLGGDVQKKYRRRYYRLIGAKLHVYQPAASPTIIHTPWDTHDLHHETHLPPPLTQTHEAHLFTIELKNIETWHSYTRNAHCRTASTTSSWSVSMAERQDNDAEDDLDDLPDPSAAFILSFKDGREMVFGVDPEEVNVYQKEADIFAKLTGIDPRETGLMGEWRAVDLTDMWKQALNEVLNGVKYEIPVWTDALKRWREEHQASALQ
ncbi:uncharacterized protein SPPG_04815 [Spizellomyces punctatus DAOM BR117]|uniref:PH domain-containing protein n=1 Tax=Spizellomyces punctatus (strain DAOM BR117) TaxID=645134 RepID=A0A0L0HI06_SPIPD|nr:uncharacterized protein SPPG_04815 [Spizellomyces punctatus DAOM BR117]KND00500.1 hypothetical protein SPPG_04815 [Spizellomyces punctatus DAOM BR117]|eukprot:XP_016608539.1 hypothetical protein SPPG_04815 [Spizellomyces punctatus DAOM BR117]